VKLREAVGEALRRRRQAQGRTLREVAAAAGVSLTYLSEVERGRKEASSEVLEAICSALDLILAELLYEVAESLAAAGRVSGGMRGAPPPAVVGFLPPPARPAATVPRPATVAPVLDLQAFAGRRSA
jgi:transcriptional regulator with XRE-family HTH domain